MNTVDIALQRHSCKAFDASRKIPDTPLHQLLDTVRLSPSSVNSQPWHILVAGTDIEKARVASATVQDYAYNTPKLLQASHALVLCSRTDLNEHYLAQLLAQEQQDGRFLTDDARHKQAATRAYYVNLHQQAKDTPQWTQKQTYLALGTLLFAASALGIDACPMEGFDSHILDTEFGLTQRGLSSTVLVALGYRSKDDFNAALPKSRLPLQEVVTLL